MWIRSVGLALSIAALLPAASVHAQERFKLQFNQVGQSSKYIAQQAYDVGDSPGHQVRIYKVQRTFTEASSFVVRGVRVTATEVNGYSDYTNGVGPIWGYEVWSMADGGKVFVQYTGSTFSEPTDTGSRRGIATSAGRIIGGSGAWKNIRGMVHSASRFDTDPQKGYSQGDNQGEYWFEE